MAYQQRNYIYPPEPHHIPTNIVFPPPQVQYMQYPQQHAYVQQSLYNQYGFPELTDFGSIGMMGEDYEDPNETTTRPRLTKEQVDVLEAQFQEHPKPNSMQKKQLAMQTKLSLPRVANWFQNRRAKAKQQRKQEEFEMSNQPPTQWSTRTKRSTDEEEEDDEYRNGEDNYPIVSGDTESIMARSQPVQSPVRPRSKHAFTDDKSAKAAGQASLQRALASAAAGMQEHMKRKSQPDLRSHVTNHMPPLPHSGQQTPAASFIGALPFEQDAPGLSWQQPGTSNHAWTPAIPDSQNMHFDFGFDQPVVDPSQTSTTSTSPMESARPAQGFVMPSNNWENPLTTPTMSHFQQHDSGHVLCSPPLPTPHYAMSRRGSGAEVLTSNFEAFNVTSSPPQSGMRTPLEATMGLPQGADNAIDIAARRKRPRPAALTSASLRSRSYGALTSSSPTCRSGPTPAVQGLRHVKSSAAGLNSHYAGIRKASVVQKSPLNVATFAEAEAFKQLMAYKNTHPAATTQPPPAMPAVEQSFAMPTMMQNGTGSNTQGPYMVMSDNTSYHQFTSPPVTPFQPEINMQMQSTMMPPASEPQYVNLNDFTPPYSAGPLTSTSWSDAPLTSPEFGSFPQMPFNGLPYQTSADENSYVLNSWGFSEGNHEMKVGSSINQKKTEFFIQEFPGQKEEHAQIAQKLPHQAPKNFVFSNTSPTDYGD